VPIGGSLPLFLFGTALYLFAMTSMGIFLATVGGNMPQFGLLLMLVLTPLQMLSGATTPRESMPEIIQNIMLAAPNTPFVILAKAVLFRGAGLAVIWRGSPPRLCSARLCSSSLFGGSEPSCDSRPRRRCSGKKPREGGGAASSSITVRSIYSGHCRKALAPCPRLMKPIRSIASASPACPQAS
jgi:ABC-2 type transporter